METVSGLSFAERVRGSLLGGACGDALGAPVEFLSRGAIQETHGPGGIRDFAPAYGRTGAITDDTQMTLFTAEGLIRAWIRAAHKGILGADVGLCHMAYLQWLVTQQREGPASPPPAGMLARRAELYARRAPGTTCLGALAEWSGFPYGTFAKNDSKGCGGVMRVAPAGFVPSLRQGPGGAFALGCDLARLTHGNVLGFLPAGVFAALLERVVAGRSLEEALADALRILAARPEEAAEREGLATLVQRARAMARAHRPGQPLPAVLGQGWVADEALAIALYAVFAAPTLEEAIVIAVNHDGDSDSTGAIAGNIAGCLAGPGAIPARWLEQLELREVIEQLAGDLAAIGEGQADLEEVEARYRPDL